ncbi:MAG: hypothetical protein WA970_25260 [Gammaproteobacteria bacterium]
MATESTEEHGKIQIPEKNANQRWVEHIQVQWQGLHGKKPG